MNDQLIKERYVNLPEYYRDFLASGFPTEAAQVLGPVANLTPEQTLVLENCIILYLLFFIEREEMASLLFNSGVDSSEAQALVNAFEESLPDFFDEVKTFAETGTLDEEIKEAEDTLRNISGLRTMAGDASVVAQAPVNTYQSSQAEILIRPEEPDVPTPTVLPPTSPTNNPARWGSE